MGRLVMDRGMRRIKASPLTAPVEDVRLVLVSEFQAAQAAQPEPQDAQEPAEQPVADETENYPTESSEAAGEEPAQPEPVVEPDAPAEADDYDPIAAVLG